ncbi:hypothetical protein HMPREF9413_2047 [Paenibacillus sp. HGF7]|nr:hypothetical protein HMPREF9413_2047 [Paenibacillus sp. HGF7]
MEWHKKTALFKTLVNLGCNFTGKYVIIMLFLQFHNTIGFASCQLTVG